MESQVGLLLTALGVLIAIIAAIPAFGSWIESRRQRRGDQHKVPPITSEILEHGAAKWRCGVYDYQPLSSIDRRSAARPHGPLIDLATQAFSSLDIEPEFFPFSYENFYDQSSLPDAVLGMFQTDRRAALMRFSRPIYEIGLQGLCRVGQTGDLLSEMREGNLKIAVYRGEVGWEFANDELPDAVREGRVIIVSGGHQLDTTDHLKLGKYDVVLMDELSCVNFLRQDENAVDFRLAFDAPISMYKASFAIHPAHAARIGSINHAIETIRNSPDFLQTEVLALLSFETVIRRRGLRLVASPTRSNGSASDR